ncbi:hypothetical protein D3C76_1166220 [compost metagenome]
MGFGELVRHDVLRRPHHQPLLHDELVVPLAIRRRYAWREVEQGQRRIVSHLALQRVAQAELGAQLGRYRVGLFDRLVALREHAFAGLEILVLADEYTIFDGAVDADFGSGQTADQHQGCQGAQTGYVHSALLKMDGARL